MSVIFSMNIEELLRQYESGKRDFSGVDLRDSDLSNVNLEEIKLNRANLENINLCHANLSNAELNLTNLSGANLSDANLNGAKLKNAVLTFAKLDRINLIGAELDYADLRAAKLSYADLERATLKYTNLFGSKLFKANLSDANLSCANLTNANLTQVKANNSKLHLAQLFKANLDGANFSESTFRGACLMQSNLSNTNLINSDLCRSNLCEANLNKAKLCKAKLNRANLTHAKLNGADLQNATLKYTNLTNADLTDANLYQADFNGSIYEHKIEYYFNGEIDKVWQQELAKTDGKVLVFSPYITRPTAIKVLSKISNKNACEIYTRFDEEDFVQGSSSIATLQELFQLGFKLYMIRDLHAKVIIVPGVFASIGSQNLTEQGTKNKESNLVIKNKVEVKKIELIIQDWLSQRFLITERMIKEIEDKLKPSLINNFIEEDDLGSDTTCRLIKRETKECVIAKITRLKDKYITLLNRDSHLTKWKLEDQDVELSKLKRYLFFNLRSNAFGWVRLADTRITYIETSLYCHNNPFTDNNKWKFILNFEFINKSQNITYNLIAHVYIYNRFAELRDSNKIGSFQIYYKLTIINEKFHLKKVETNLLNLSPVETDVYDWIENQKDFQEKVLDLLTSPFQYQEKLTGVKASEFFGELGTEYIIKLTETNDGQYILVAK